MGQQVCMGAMIHCTFGVAPGTLSVLPMNLVMTGTPAALSRARLANNPPPCTKPSTV